MSIIRGGKIILARITREQLEWIKVNAISTESMMQVKFMLSGGETPEPADNIRDKRRLIFNDGRVSSWLSSDTSSVASWSQLKPRKLPEKALAKYHNRGLQGSNPLRIEMVQDKRAPKLARNTRRK